MIERRRPWWWPALVVFAVGFGLSLAQPSCALHRDVRLEALRSLVDLDRTYAGDPGPSIVAAARLMRDPRASIYAPDLSVGSSFIYPPIAAALYRPLAPLAQAQAKEWISIANHVLLVLIVASVVQLATARRKTSVAEVAAWIAAAVVFYPLAHAVELNQATLVVTALLGAAFLALDAGHPVAAGVALALAAAVKPQLVTVLPLLAWHARRLVASAVATGAVVLGASLAYAGIANHVDYVTRVLPSLSRGYAYYANQSLNGLYNRLEPGAVLSVLEQPAPSLLVTTLTLTTALAVLGGAALLVHRWAARGGVEPATVLAFAWLIATLVSPIAWQHHYAPALFAFALLVRQMREDCSLRRSGVALTVAGAFTLMSSYFEVRSLQGVGARLAVSYVLYGAVALGAGLALGAEARSARWKTANAPTVGPWS